MMARVRRFCLPGGTVAALSVLMLVGCSQSGSAPETGGPPVATNDPVALFAASSSPGAEGTVVLPDTGQSVRVRLMRTYFAASGRECREVAVGSSQAIRLICRATDGWVVARPLITSSIGQP